MELSLVNAIRERRGQEALKLLRSLAKNLDEANALQQGQLFLGTMTQAAIYGGASMPKVIETHEKYLSKIRKQTERWQIVAILEDILKDYLELLEAEHSPAIENIEKVEQVVSFLRANYSENIKLKNVAAYVYLSPTYLCRIFKETTGTTISQFLTNIRIEEAKKLLVKTELSFKAISYCIGYQDPNYFTRNFKKIVGVLPSEYRKMEKLKT